jgi:hypothetical protein
MSSTVNSNKDVKANFAIRILAGLKNDLQFHDSNIVRRYIFGLLINCEKGEIVASAQSVDGLDESNATAKSSSSISNNNVEEVITESDH